jgi:hypothetical protein
LTLIPSVFLRIFSLGGISSVLQTIPNIQIEIIFFKFVLMNLEASAGGVKTPGGGFVLTRFLLPFHRMEKEEPVRLEDKKIWIFTNHINRSTTI